MTMGISDAEWEARARAAPLEKRRELLAKVGSDAEAASKEEVIEMMLALVAQLDDFESELARFRQEHGKDPPPIPL